MKTKQPIQTILTLGAVVLAASSQGQTLLYDNGPVNGTIYARTIDNIFAVTDSFTLGTRSTVASATVGIWTASGDSLTSVQWSITTAHFGGTTLASGTATTTDTFFGVSSGPSQGYDVYSDSFSITPTSLAGGTYWFQLNNGVTMEHRSQDIYWDQNNGPSLAYQTGNGSIPSESFQLYSAPEPSTMALAGLGGLTLLRFRRRK